MSLADLVPVATACDFRPVEYKEPGPAAKARRWQRKNRAHLTAYKRRWRANRRAAGLRVT